MGGFHYPNQIDHDVLGLTRGAPVTLTTDYTDNISEPFITRAFVQMTVYWEYTPGAGGGGNSFQLKIEGSPDDTDPLAPSPLPIFYQESFDTIVTTTEEHFLGEHSFTGAVAGTVYRGYFYSPPAQKQIRMSAKETVGGGAAGTLKIRVLLSGL